jgi:hypothetical protein
MMESDSPRRGDIPTGSVINCELVITSYFDTDGQLKYATAVAGDPNLAQALGLCELAKSTVYRSYMLDEPYPPDLQEEDDDDGEN